MPIASDSLAKWLILDFAERFQHLDCRFFAAENTMNAYESSLFRILVGHYVHSIRFKIEKQMKYDRSSSSKLGL